MLTTAEADERSARGALRGAAWIVGIGVVLGVAYNGLGLAGRHPWGLAWIGADRLEQLASAGTVTAQPADDGYATSATDPLAVPATRAATRLPEIPAVGRPVQIELAAFKQLVDAGAALVLDARDTDEYAAGHIPGALSLPYDRAATDPESVEALDPGGRPIVTYCGGGACEASLSLANELVFAEFPRVAVFMGGYPEWVAAGYPVAQGAPEEAH